MPVITFEGGTLNREQKRDLIHRFTSVASEVTNIPAQFFSVLIREQEDANLGFGGETVEEIKARMHP
ncbi:MAG: hypothetical protein Fur0034_01270 [Desulfuromonadia bacterium]